MPLSPRTTPRRAGTRRRDRPDARKVAFGGVVAIVLLFAVIWEGIRAVNGVPVVASYRTVYVQVPQVGNLLLHDPVKIDGVHVGQVIARDVSPTGKARIELKLSGSVKLPTGTKVVLRANGLLGARYVQLIPGTGNGFIPNGATITGGANSFTYGLPEAVDTFDQKTRGALGQTLRGLGEGMLGNGTTVNNLIRNAAPAAPQFKPFALAVLAHTGAPARLSTALDAAMTPLAANATKLATDNGLAADAIGPFITQRGQIRQTLTQAPGDLQAFSGSVPSGVTLVDSLHDLSTALNGTLPAAPRGLRSLNVLLHTSKTPLMRAANLLKSAMPAVPGILHVVRALKPVTPAIKDGLKSATPIITKLLDPYRCDIEMFGASMRSMTGYMQPGLSGPSGPAEGFRALAVAPLDTSVLGIQSKTHELTRVHDPAPCQFKPSVYPQFTSSGTG